MELYEPLEEIGTGAFGRVTKIKRKTDGRILVWKELNYGVMNEREKQQIVAEVNIIRELRSPFIVRYYDRIVDKQNTKLYIVMEYCAGGDLGQIIKRCKRNRANLDEAVIWKALAQMLTALKDCHHRQENGAVKPILHRDIKPANILLDQNQNIKLGDFGLAKELASAGKLAQTHVGTPFYMSPELINGRAYDEKSDIWSIGCLLYELAALRPPFDASNQLQLAMKINAGKFQRIPSKYSDGLFDVIKLCLQVDPSRRPSLADIEGLAHLAPLQSAIRDAKKIAKEYETHQNYSDKLRDLKSREEALRAREEALIAKEVAVRAREEALDAAEAELERKLIAVQQRETLLQERGNSNLQDATAEAQQMISDFTDMEGGGNRMSLCNQPPFHIHQDEGLVEPFVGGYKAQRAGLRTGEESAKENSTAQRRSAKIDNILARASALTQHRPIAINSGTEVSITKRLMTETPVLTTHGSSPAPELNYMNSNDNEGSASKRRRRCDYNDTSCPVTRPPPPPPCRNDVPSVQVDLKALLRRPDPSALRTRNINAAAGLEPFSRRPSKLNVGSHELLKKSYDA